MTVAAVVLAASPGEALRPVEGVANARRLVDVAWSGGATPVVVCAPDPDGGVVAALAGAPVTYAQPAPGERGPIGQMVDGFDVAVRIVAETEAALLWPARLGWVDAETVTTLIETHGLVPSAVLRPTYRGAAGWPVLVPRTALEAFRMLDPAAGPDELVEALAGRVETRLVEVGDPGVIHPLDTARRDLPPYDGPDRPPAEHAHEWGAPIADLPDDRPLEGPALAPYAPAEDDA